MAEFTAKQLYDALRDVGFDPVVSERLATWGLWRQDITATPGRPFVDELPDHPEAAPLDLDDLEDNARAAYIVSGGGAVLEPWAVPVGQEAWDAYAASVASVAESEVPLAGVEVAADPTAIAVEGTSDDMLGPDDDTVPVPPQPEPGPAPVPQPEPVPEPEPSPAPEPAPEPVPQPEPSPAPEPAPEPDPQPAPGLDGDGPDVTEQFLALMLAQAGDSYVFGAETSLDDLDPDAFDCSEIIQWAAGRLGVEVPDGTWNQYLWLKEQGMLIPVEDAEDTPGALLFRFSSEPTPGGSRPSSAHVAVSLGDGSTIEARGSAYGVGSWEASGRFGYAAVIPQLSDGSAHLLEGDDLLADVGTGDDGELETVLAAYEDAPQVDTDLDGLLDALETDLGLDPESIDSDGDDLSDSFELLIAGTDPTSADTDGDGVADALELALGTDALDPDSDRDGILDGTERAGTDIIDADADGLEDALEELIGTDPTRIDSDGDGLADGLEYLSDHDPLDPLSASGAGPGAGFEDEVGDEDLLDDLADDVVTDITE